MLVRMPLPTRRLRVDVLSNRFDHMNPEGEGLVQVAVAALRPARAVGERAPGRRKGTSSNRFAGS
jgi:hypothetical protein